MTASNTSNGDSVRDRLNRPVHDLRISVIDKCNLRCTYCMPAEEFHDRYEFLKNEERLSFEEIARVARAFVSVGVTKLRLTGGEPLLRKNLPELVAMLADIQGVDDLALTTNGLLLPQHAEALRAAGLQRITVSLDTLNDAIFKEMSGRDRAVAEALAGIDAADKAGLGPVKINTVVQRGINDHTVLELVERFRGTGHILRFIEYMDVGNRNHWKAEQVVASRDILKLIGERWPLRPLKANYHGEVADRYAFEDGAGEIGFISSVTEPFCGDCTRARVSADGKVFTCLFAGEGTDLRGLLRGNASDEALTQYIAGIWRMRQDRYSEIRAELASDSSNRHKVEMYQIGG